jgi:RNA polymerase sigma factor (sigma-70 family)
MKNDTMEQGGEHFKTMATRLKRGDIGAGDEAFTYFSPLLYRFFLTRTTNRTAAEDLTQDVFFKIISKIDTFDDERGNFPGWIWQIARNTLIDHFREKKTIAFADAGEGIEAIGAAVDDTDQRMKVQAIMEAVGRLSDEEQELFSLRYVSDVSYKDMSGMLGRSEPALRVALHRLNKKVKDIIIEEV